MDTYNKVSKYVAAINAFNWSINVWEHVTYPVISISCNQHYYMEIVGNYNFATKVTLPTPNSSITHESIQPFLHINNIYWLQVDYKQQNSWENTEVFIQGHLHINNYISYVFLCDSSLFWDTHKAIYNKFTWLEIKLQNKGIIMPSALKIMAVTTSKSAYKSLQTTQNAHLSPMLISSLASSQNKHIILNYSRKKQC